MLDAKNPTLTKDLPVDHPPLQTPGHEGNGRRHVPFIQWGTRFNLWETMAVQCEEPSHVKAPMQKLQVEYES